MQPIEKALEKARQGRKTHLPAYGKAGAYSGAEPLPSFVYEQTRVEPVQAKVLRKNRIIAGFAHDPHADIFRMLRVQALK